jgi:hypothetical protein
MWRWAGGLPWGWSRFGRCGHVQQGSLFVGGSTGKIVEGIADGVKEARVEGGGVGLDGLVQVVRPSSGMDAVRPSSCEQQGRLSYRQPRSYQQGPIPPKAQRCGGRIGSQKGGVGQDGQGLVGDGQMGPTCLALGVLQQEDLLGDVQGTLVVLAHLDGEQYHIKRM